MHAVELALPETITDPHHGVGFTREEFDQDDFFLLEGRTRIGVEFTDGTKLSMIGMPIGAHLDTLEASTRLTAGLCQDGLNVDTLADVPLFNIGVSVDRVSRKSWTDRIYVGKVLLITPTVSLRIPWPLEIGLVSAIRLQMLPD